MRELPLDQIEELVEESVFHPSPCKRHRERVLKNALQAAVRQKVSRRTIGVALAAVVAGLVLPVPVAAALVAAVVLLVAVFLLDELHPAMTRAATAATMNPPRLHRRSIGAPFSDKCPVRSAL